MKILILNYEYPPLGGGGGKQSMYLANELSKIHDVYFLTAGWNEFGITTSGKFTLHRIKTSRKRIYRSSSKEMLNFVMEAWKIIPSVLKVFNPDAALIYFTIPTGLLTFHPKLRKIPYVISVRGSDVPGHNPDRFKELYILVKPVAKIIWKRASAIVCNSNDLKKEVHGIAPSLKIDVIPNGIDTQKFRSDVSGKNKEQLVLLYVGRLIPLKRIDCVIKALPLVIKNSTKKITFNVVGSGIQEDELKSITGQLKLNDHVFFKGEADFFGIESEYKKADIYIQLSKTEGMSNTIVEAMACGLPVITSDVGGVGEFMDDNGFVLQDISSEEIANAVKKYTDDPGLYERHSKNSRKVAERFNWSSVSQQYNQLIQKCVE